MDPSYIYIYIYMYAYVNVCMYIYLSLSLSIYIYMFSSRVLVSRVLLRDARHGSTMPGKRCACFACPQRWEVPGCVSNAVTPRRLGDMPRVQSPSGRAMHYKRLKCRTCSDRRNSNGLNVLRDQITQDGCQTGGNMPSRPPFVGAAMWGSIRFEWRPPTAQRAVSRALVFLFVRIENVARH